MYNRSGPITVICRLCLAFHCKERWKDLQQKYVDEYMSADEVMSDWVHFEAMEAMREYILCET